MDRPRAMGVRIPLKFSLAEELACAYQDGALDQYQELTHMATKNHVSGTPQCNTSEMGLLLLLYYSRA